MILLFPVQVKVKMYSVSCKDNLSLNNYFYEEIEMFSIDVKVLYGTSDAFNVDAELHLHLSHLHVFNNENKMKYYEQSVMSSLPRRAQVPKSRRVLVKTSLKAEILLQNNKLLKDLIFLILCLANHLTFLKLLHNSFLRGHGISATCALLLLSHYIMMFNTGPGHTTR